MYRHIASAMGRCGHCQLNLVAHVLFCTNTCMCFFFKRLIARGLVVRTQVGLPTDSSTLSWKVGSQLAASSKTQLPDDEAPSHFTTDS